MENELRRNELGRPDGIDDVTAADKNKSRGRITRRRGARADTPIALLPRRHLRFPPIVVFPHAPVITNLSAVSDNAHLEELNAVPRADGSQYLTRRRVARNSGDHSSDGPRVRSGAGDGSYLREIDGNVMRGDGGDAAPAVALHESFPLAGRFLRLSTPKTQSDALVEENGARRLSRTQGLPKGVTT
ncbi:hypothetical protein BD626DRAFT_638846 [Schizophyllum amplum]|uniref:Uncharacterized protein n=1 Tax=Schizophyllum amplum TaxID=97359 RepID=A0A550BRF6_9AGAR|nr:hypothetical protein BD626DRAFT_638846 [Auriculariopsis ampla]